MTWQERWILGVASGFAWGIALPGPIGALLVVLGGLGWAAGPRGHLGPSLAFSLAWLATATVGWWEGTWTRFGAPWPWGLWALFVAVQAISPTLSSWLAGRSITGAFTAGLAMEGLARWLSPAPLGPALLLVATPVLAWPAALGGRSLECGVVLGMCAFAVRRPAWALPTAGVGLLVGAAWLSWQDVPRTSVAVIEPAIGAWDGRTASTGPDRRARIEALVARTAGRPAYLPEGAWPGPERPPVFALRGREKPEAGASRTTAPAEGGRITGGKAGAIQVEGPEHPPVFALRGREKPEAGASRTTAPAEGGRITGGKAGAIQVEGPQRPPVVSGADHDGQNAVVTPQGTLFGKRYLVPVAERRWLGLGTDRYRPGALPRRLEADGITLAPLVCYEDLLPAAIAEIPADATLLLCASNDGWLGPGRPSELHLAATRLAAIESGRWAVRPTSCGRSAIVDRFGRLVASTSWTDADEAPNAGTVLIANVDLRAPRWTGAAADPWLGAAGIAALLAEALLRRRSAPKPG